ncbi:MAG: M23 family metallopeptidase [Rhizomicrobium sp.]|jgi:murein DD-endopeptidase MepM/ murein hydrolase activator NlpD
MIERRLFIASSAAFLALPAFAAPSRLALSGTMQDGGMVLGKTEPTAKLTLDGNALYIGSSGDFVFGLGYDQSKSAVLLATFADGTSEARSIVPAARQYEIQRITGLPEKMVTLPPDVLERRKKEIAQIAEARKRVTDATWYAEPFDWPIAGIVSDPYGGQRILNGEPRAPHLAIDIAAPAGTQIRAPAPGVVSLAGPDFYLEGGLTILDHGQGVSTCYLHQSKQLVKVGDKVARGDVIGLVGMTGRATGPHLHWGLNWFQVALDPSLSTRTPSPAKS